MLHSGYVAFFEQVAQHVDLYVESTMNSVKSPLGDLGVFYFSEVVVIWF